MLRVKLDVFTLPVCATHCHLTRPFERHRTTLPWWPLAPNTRQVFLEPRTRPREQVLRLRVARPPQNPEELPERAP